jgi:hypothetical protein
MLSVKVVTCDVEITQGSSVSVAFLNTDIPDWEQKHHMSLNCAVSSLIANWQTWQVGWPLSVLFQNMI